MNFKSIYTRVQNYIADSSATTLVIIKESINLKAAELLQRGLFRFAIRDTSISTTSGTSEYYLPNDVDKILDMRQENTPLKMKNIWIGDFDRLVPSPTRTGVPTNYSELVEEMVKAQPTTAGVVDTTSTSNQDISGGSGATAFVVFGVADSEDRTETVALSATNAVSTTLQFTKVYSITTDVPLAGTMTAIGGGSTTLVTLYPNETFRVYRKFKLHPIPDGTYTIYFRYQALQRKMVNDADACIIPDRYSDVLANAVIADMLLQQGDVKAKSYYQLQEQGVQRILKEQDMLYDFVPEVRGDEGVYRDNSYPFTNY